MLPGSRFAFVTRRLKTSVEGEKSASWMRNQETSQPVQKVPGLPGLATHRVLYQSLITATLENPVVDRVSTCRPARDK